MRMRGLAEARGSARSCNVRGCLLVRPAREASAHSSAVAAMGVKDRPQCYFEIEINREPAGRITFQLFSDVCPKTCKNFLCLCTGEKGIGKTTGKKLCYKGSTFHRVVKNFMIQGGDFSEGNGKGGESIYGGYFKDENFVLKHDRAFLLSMANRGKHTNGSQFFITTKPAPHLDSVHVVFGLVISGFEVIEQIENLKTDAASRPYADVRVTDTGVLVTESVKDGGLEKINKASSEAANVLSKSSSSESLLSASEFESEKNRKKKRKRRTKVKHVKKKRKEEREEKKSEEQVNKKAPSLSSRHSDHNDANEEWSRDFGAKREKLVVRPEEIPPVPENKFLLRRDIPFLAQEPEPKPLTVTPVVSDQKPSVSKSGRKIKGRGTIRYHTPPRSRSCSESKDDESSETPPHWKEEMQRLRAYRSPSGEKWSKGDKLNDTYLSRWDERSLSQRSRSWSHDGYYSDRSRERVSHMKKHRKDKKKLKHKKKSKKQKHSKKHKLTKKEASPLPEAESSCSSSRRTKSSYEKEKRSCSSVSSRHSSKRDWSKSEKGHYSSSSRESQSYSRSISRSRSYSRESSRSRTVSKSSSRSRGRSRSKSRSKRSRSKSRSTSYSGSRSVSSSSSKSRDRRTVSGSPKKVIVHAFKSKPNKPEPVIPISQAKDKLLVPPVLTESIPVMPLSDSPPPSRWKPGQKPWKPSYERIQEMNVKTSHLMPAQIGNYALIKTREASVASYHKHERSSDSEQSDSSKYRSDRSSGRRRRSKSRSSRSRSYTRSYSRSRSSRSQSKCHSDSSSYNRSSSYDSYCKNRSPRKRSTSSEKNFDSRNKKSSSESDLDRPQNNRFYQSPKPNKSVSTSGSSTDSEIERKLLTVLEVVKSLNSDQEQDQCKLNNNGEEQKSRLENNEEYEHSNKETSVKDVVSEKCRNDENMNASSNAFSKLESPSYSQKENTSYREMSDKEEGEATSESDTPVSDSKSRSKTISESSDIVPSFVSDSNPQKLSKQQSSDSESSQSSSENNRRKSKKHKKLSQKGNIGKVKRVKNKSKETNDKKHKGQKRKPAFHWQPPLEFGEEEEDDMVLEKTALQIDKENEKQCDVCDKTEKSSEGTRQVKRYAVYDHSPDHTPLNKEITKQKYSFSTLSPKQNLDVVEENSFASKKIKISQVESEDETQMDNITNFDQTSNAAVTAEGLSPVGTKFNTNSGKTETQYLQTNQLIGGLVNHGNIGNETAGAKEENVEIDDSNSSDFPAIEENVNTEKPEVAQSLTVDNKWKPVQAASSLQINTSVSLLEVLNSTVEPEVKPQGLRIEIKSKNKVRPGSLFDEVRKTARLNQRPRNQESSSEEQSPSRDGKSRSRSLSRSRSKSKSKSRDRTKSRTRTPSSSPSRSRSRSSSYSYRSRSYGSRRNRRLYSREWTRSRSSSYNSYRSRRTYSRSRSRSSSSGHHRRSRSRSYTYDSYYSRSPSRSRSKRSYSYRRSHSSDRRSRSQRSRSYSGSDRSSSHHRSPSESSSYS
ncbi:NK-tumor recognition protein isoform X2 [Rhinatrema bivittatum]|uniref:NK-tumor recognition protein isoform X2 n=1 Tax=Rhinatrema bivittatum TaxID=194408 RepID=UPI0011299FEA|nr:NK-tumor recognition protein isoform X2 [Rhinatrema bivittatum]